MNTKSGIFLVVLSLVFLSKGELLIQSNSSLFMGSFNVVNVHKNLEVLWHDGPFHFEGVIQKNSLDGVDYYNISNFIFFDQADTNYLFRSAKYVTMGKLQEMGALVAVIKEKIDPPGRRYIFDRNRPGVSIPVAAINASDTGYIFDTLDECSKNSTYISITISIDENTWTSFLPVILVFNVILAIFGGAALILSGYKIFLFIKEGQFEFSVGVICLLLCFLGDIQRIIGAILDPYLFIEYDDYVLCTVFLVSHFPFLISSGLIITFYWAEAIRPKTGKISKFLNAFRVPFFIVVGVLFAIFIGIFTLFFIDAGDLTVIILAICSLLSLALGIFFFVIALRVMKLLDGRPGKPLSITKKIIVASCLMLVLVIAFAGYTIVNAVAEWKYRAIDFIFLTLVWVSSIGISFTFSTVFHPRSLKTASGKSTAQNSQ
eukprot:TRINITY_DN6503_c0_g1_i1.p1 TRINITY_DN6503_c0_g1~~TRINITY_DN6503_c0_g1_i1.p1  ORF type:complete len:431 (+),score=52.68 TRINITY_DN6503_c0_g1_i1:1-1293(+)